MTRNAEGVTSKTAPVRAQSFIGLMSDTDNAGGEALAYFDDVRLARLPRHDQDQ